MTHSDFNFFINKTESFNHIYVCKTYLCVKIYIHIQYENHSFFIFIADENELEMWVLLLQTPLCQRIIILMHGYRDMLTKIRY